VTRFVVDAAGSSSGVRVGAGADHDLTIRSWGGVFAHAPEWWRNFELVREAERGLDAHEDYFTPGTLDLALPTFPAVSGDDLIHSTEWSAELHSSGASLTTPATTADEAIAARRARLGPMIKAARAGACPEDAEIVARLACAADAFVVRRGTASATGTGARSVIAGYPWFSDWGRDTLLSLPGLFLKTGRLDEARAVLGTFAAATSEGVVPNCFDDRTGEPMYNTADASLWYLHAACRWAKASRGPLPPAVLAACLSIVDWYQRGTKHGIRVDTDGLLEAGDAGFALTWMDAKRDGVVFTPRAGKPVELQALWYSGLLELADTVEANGGDGAGLARELRQVAYRCGDSLVARFWNPARGCLYDVITAQGPDAALRPNQIFAVSQPYSALSAPQQRGVFGVVKDRLLTPQGLRTLAPNEPGYQGRYRGPLFERDRAYHNGTVWPWLIGAYARAARAVGHADEGRSAALAAASHLTKDGGGGLGSIAEIYEGDALADGSRRADGCPAQAWSVAEVLDALTV